MLTAVVFFLSGEADLGRVAVLEDADVFPVADPIELFFVEVGDRPTGEDAVVRFVVGLFRIVAGVVGIRVVDARQGGRWFPRARTGCHPASSFAGEGHGL